jgi:Family of unknown function (DUF6161)
MADEQPLPTEPLRFQIAGKEHAFDSPAALAAFASEQRKPWDWLQKNNSVEPLQQEWSQFRSFLTEIETLANRLPSANDQQFTDMFNKIGVFLNNFWTCRFRTQIAEGRRELALRLSNAEATLAYHVLNAWVAQPGHGNFANPPAIRGAVVAALFDEGITGRIDRTDIERDAVATASRWWGDFQSAARSQLAAVRESVVEFARETRLERCRHNEEFEKLVDESRGRLTELEQTFKEKLALRAPVSYWTNKAAEHLEQSKLWGARFGILLLFSALVFAFELSEFWDLGMDQSLAAGGAAALPKSLAAWQTVFLVTTATLLFWPLRILARLLLANVHLRLDAQERATMANTYLSLIAEGKEMPAQDRQLILSALFRSTVTGIVRDEGAPPSAFDIASRMITR